MCASSVATQRLGVYCSLVRQFRTIWKSCTVFLIGLPLASFSVHPKRECCHTSWLYIVILSVTDIIFISLFRLCVRFLNKYASPIEEGRQKNASAWEVKKAAEMNQKLQQLLQPYFLQRLKSSEFSDKLPTKKELVVFVSLSDKQRRLYQKCKSWICIFAQSAHKWVSDKASSSLHNIVQI